MFTEYYCTPKIFDKFEIIKWWNICFLIYEISLVRGSIPSEILSRRTWQYILGTDPFSYWIFFMDRISLAILSVDIFCRDNVSWGHCFMIIIHISKHVLNGRTTVNCQKFTYITLHIYIDRFTSTLACMMDLHNYPLDIQNCTVEIESCKFHIIFPLYVCT